MANIECNGKVATKTLEIFNDDKTKKWTITIGSDGSLIFSI